MGQVRVGVIGCGYWGPKLIRNFAACPLTTLAVVCDDDPARMAAIGSMYPQLALVDSVDRLLERDMHAVAIATPVATHFALARRCLEAGLHVLVEKPMTATAGEARALVDLAERLGKVLMVDHTYLFCSSVRRVKAMADQGELGDLHSVDSIRIGWGRFDRGVNVIWDLASHDLAVLDYILGPRVRSIAAWGHANVHEGVEDVAHLSVDYGVSTMAHVHVSWLSPVKVRQVSFGGSRRSVIFKELGPVESLEVHEHSVDPGARSVRYLDAEGDEPLQVVVRHFAECVRGEKAPLSDGALGLRVVRLLEAASLSLQGQGKRVVPFGRQGLCGLDDDRTQLPGSASVAGSGLG